MNVPSKASSRLQSERKPTDQRFAAQVPEEHVALEAEHHGGEDLAEPALEGPEGGLVQGVQPGLKTRVHNTPMKTYCVALNGE